jgi:hypothetical protein
MSGKRHRYFAYGSNLDPVQMEERCPDAAAIGAALLPGHRLAFTRSSKKRQCGVADVVVCELAETWGVMFAITDTDLAKLDRSEGYNRVTDSGSYLWRPKQVRLQGSSEFTAVFTYIVETRESPEPLPSRAYLGQIMSGARHWKLPGAYIEMLSKIQTKD